MKSPGPFRCNVKVTKKCQHLSEKVRVSPESPSAPVQRDNRVGNCGIGNGNGHGEVHHQDSGGKAEDIDSTDETDKGYVHLEVNQERGADFA